MFKTKETKKPSKQKCPHFLEAELIHVVAKAKYMWLIVGQLPIKKLDGEMLPSGSGILAEAINMKKLTKNQPDPRIPTLIPCILTPIPRIPTLIPRIPNTPSPHSPHPHPHSPHPHPDSPHSNLDSPRSHPDSLRSHPDSSRSHPDFRSSHIDSSRSHHSPHSVLKFPILVFRNSQ